MRLHNITARWLLMVEATSAPRVLQRYERSRPNILVKANVSMLTPE
jgi:hypothetical protein